MPVVHITTASDAEDARAIGDAVHAAMVETIGIPLDDRFQILHPQPAATLIYDRSFSVERSDDFVLIEISLAAGRSDATKESLYAAIAARLALQGRRPEDVFISLHEVGIADFSLGGGIAQFVRDTPERLRALLPQRV